MIRTARRQSLESQYFLNLASQAIGRAVSFGANFVSYIIIGRIAGIEFFGKFSYVLAFLGLFAAIADSGMCSVLGRGITQEEKQAGLYWGNFLFLRVALSLAVIPFGIIAAFYMRRDLFPILLPGMLAIPFLAARFFEPIFQVYRRPWHSTYSSVSYGVSYCLFLALVLMFTKSLLFHSVRVCSVEHDICNRCILSVLEVHKAGLCSGPAPHQKHTQAGRPPRCFVPVRHHYGAYPDPHAGRHEIGRCRSHIQRGL